MLLNGRVLSVRNFPLNTVLLKTNANANATTTDKNTPPPYQDLIQHAIDYSKIKVYLPKEFKCDENLVVPPLDQGQCGSCWAFATTASLTDRINISLRRKQLTYSLTPTILVSCNFFAEDSQTMLFTKEYVKTLTNLNNVLQKLGCHGNSVVHTCFFLHVWGTFTDNCVPYNGVSALDESYNRFNFGLRSTQYIKEDKIQFTKGVDNSITCGSFFGNAGETINLNNCYARIINLGHIYQKSPLSYRNLFYYSIKDVVNHNEYLMKDIKVWGPICTTFTVYQDFYDFDPLKGVYISNEDPNTIAGGHAVCISGWGDYYDENTKKTIPFWWIKNSWGESYGFKGYFRMLRGSNHCLLEENVIGMVPNCYPQSPAELEMVITKLAKRWHFEKTVQPAYFKLYREILNEYCILLPETMKTVFTEKLLEKYPVIDFFFFRMKFKTSFVIDPSTGYSYTNQNRFPGLDYLPPYTYKNMKQISSIYI
jgi:hypothetical protein